MPRHGGRTIFDERSLEIFQRELSALYNAYVKDESPGLPQLTVQYADYTTHQLTYLQSPSYQRDLEYWTSQLADAEFSLGLPTDHPQPPQPTYQGRTESFELGKTLQEQLLAIAQENGTTPFMFFLAAFQVLLHKCTQKEDILVGTPITVRDHPEVQDLMGLFLNTVVLRATLAPEERFTELLGHVRQTTLEAYSHRHLPFEHLVRAIQPDRQSGQHPLFQVMFVYDHDSEGMNLQGLETRSMHIANPTTKFDLTLSLTRSDQGLGGAIEYSTDLFESATIRRMIGHLETLLRSICENPQQRICDLAILTEAERQQLLVAWNDTERPYARDKCIHQLFEAQAERTPQAIAAVSGGDQLTYEQLNRKANRLAHRLRKLGIGTDVLVAFYLQPSVDLIVGVLGILKAGGAYVPLDPSSPAKRLDAMVRDVNPALILSQTSLEPKTPEDIPHLYLDEAWAAANPDSDSNLPCQATPDSLVYAIFTSGSTGSPKAAAVYHRGFTNLLDWYTKELTLTEDDRTLLVSAPTFDLTQKNLFAPLMTGGVLHLLPAGTYDPALIRRTIKAERITIVNCTPSAFYPLIDTARERDCSDLATLRAVVLGGEPILLSRLRPWLEGPYFHAEILNTYGPTECTDIATCFRLSNPTAFWDRSLPIGRPIDHVQVFILDRQQRLLPIGTPGELYIGGAGVGAGYVANPDLTASRFLQNPYSQGARTELYRTGDLARFLPDGNIEFLGREDHQVKIRGFRIELAEVTSAVLALPQIRDAAVAIRSDPQDEAQLVAYVVPAEPGQFDVSGFRQALEQELPRYMVPTVFVELDTLPLNAHGKVDLQALPSPAQSTRNVQQSKVAPRNATEQSVLAIWVEILKHNRIGVFDSFYELGGHSLLMVKVHSRICRLFQRDIGIRELFERPTVAAQAVALDDSDDTEDAARLLEQMLSEVESLSEEDAAVELQETNLPAAGPAVRTKTTKSGSTSLAGRDIEAETPNREESSVQIQTLALVTANRVKGLKCNLESYLQHSRRYDRCLRFPVFDDSQDEATRVENRQALVQLAQDYGANISYAGHEEKRLFAAMLLDHTDLPADIVNFALFDVYKTGYSPGANRNAVLLGTIGAPLFIADDDTVCRLSQTGEVREDLSLAVGCDPSEYWFFPDRKQPVQQAQYIDRDLLGLHEQWLGKKVGDLPAYTLHERCCPDRLAQVRERLNGNQARIELILNGLVGDCGWASPFHYLMVEGPSLQRLVATEEAYRQACTSRGMIRTVQQPTLADASFFMSTFFSLDNRACPPPFLPAMHGQDHLFAATYWHCRSHSWFLHLPWTLNHEPVGDRQFWPGEIFRQASGYSLIELLLGILDAAPANPSVLDASQRMQALGTYLMDLSKLPKQQFYDCMCEQTRGDKNQQLADIEKHLTTHPNAPQYWAQDLRRYQSLLRQALERADFWIPLDLKVSGSDKEPAEQVRHWIRKYGELLYWWPAIVAKARALEEGGQSLAQPI